MTVCPVSTWTETPVALSAISTGLVARRTIGSLTLSFWHANTISSSFVKISGLASRATACNLDHLQAVGDSYSSVTSLLSTALNCGRY